MDLLSLPRHHPEEVKSKRTFVGGWTSADVVSVSTIRRGDDRDSDPMPPHPPFHTWDAAPLPFTSQRQREMLEMASQAA